jgi:hypothetical protein
MNTGTKTVILLVAGVVLGVAAGFTMARHGITVYRHDGFRTVVHKDWPIYGLPLVEYTFILNLIDKENTDEAKNRLNMFLDQAVQDAMDRYRVTSGRDREEIRKALVRVAEYRQTHPRPLTTNDTPVTVFWNRDRQLNEDKFLSDLLNAKGQE